MGLSQFRSWVRKVAGAGRSRPVVARRAPRAVFGLERLDDRLTPSAVSWTGSGDGTSWADGRNWSTGVTPGAADDVTINTFATITHSGADAVNSLTFAGGTLANSGSLTTGQGLTLNGSFATLANTGTLTVDGAFAWSNGTLSGTGHTVLNGSSSLSGGFFSMLTDQQVDNHGTATITDGNSIDFRGNAVWNNDAGSTFVLQGSGSIGNFFPGPTSGFNNLGTLQKTGPAGAASVGVAFNNSGTVDVQAGTLTLSSGGVGGGTFTIESGATLSAGNYTLQDATVNGASALQVGTFNTLTVAGASTVQNLTVSGGTLTANAPFDVQNLAVTSGAVTVNAPLTVQALAITGGTVTANAAVDAQTLTLGGGTLTGPAAVTVHGTFTWTGGTLSGTGDTVLDGASTLTGSFFSPLARPIDNYGTATVVAGTSLNFQSNAVWTNNAGSTLVLPDSAGLSPFFSAGSALNNAGTVVKTAPAGTATIGVAFNNTGTVDVQAGTLSLTAGGTGGGTFTVEPGALLSVSSYTLQDAAVTGAVQAVSSFPAGALTVAGSTTLQTLAVAGGSVVTSSNLALPTLTITSGTVTANAPLEVQNLTLGGGTLTGPAAVTVDDTFTWTNGTLSGTGDTVLNGTSTLTGSFFSPLSRQVDNYGTATVVAGTSLNFQNNAIWNNQPGSVLVLPDSAGLSPFFSAGSALNNAGTVVKAAPAGTATIGVAFNNTGTVDVQAGTLSLTGGGTGGGTFTVEPGAVLTAGNYTLQNATVSGPGTLQVGTFNTLTVAGASTVQNLTVNGGTVAANAALDVQALAVSGGTVTANALVDVQTLILGGGTVTGPGTVTVDNTFTWTNGTLSGTGDTVLNGTSSLSGGFFSMLGRPVDNNGTVIITDGNSVDFTGNAVWNNNATGTLVLQGSGSLGTFFTNPTAVLNNAGLIRKSGPAGTSSTGIPVNNTGTIEVDAGTLTTPAGFTTAGTVTVAAGGGFTTAGNYAQTSGTTAVNGTLAANNTVAINGGSLTGSGVVNANVTNAGRVAPGAGPAVLTVHGSYTQTATGALDVQISGPGAGSGYGQLSVSGPASLAGALDVTDPNNFAPGAGDTFEVLAFAAHTGDFAAYTGLDLGNGRILRPAFVAGDKGLDLVTYVATTTAVTTSVAGNTSVYGQDVTFTATVAAADGGTPTGTVQFQINGADVGSPVSLVGGTATFDPGVLPAGSYQVTAVYSGAGFDLGGTSDPLAYTVNPDPTTTTLATSPAVTAHGQSVTFTASVAANLPGSGTPTGSVSFYDGSILLDTVPLPAGGPDQVSFTTSALGVGTHTITAVYSGDDNFVASTSAGATEIILGPGVAVFGTTLYVVGADTADYAQINPVGASGTGSTGLQVNSTLNGVWSSKTFAQPFTAVEVFGYGGNDTIQMGSSLTVDAAVVEGDGNDYIQTAGGNDVITFGRGSTQVFGGNGNKTITGHDAAGSNVYVQLGTGTDVVTLGAGNDQVVLGNGNNTVTAGDGNDAVTAGNGNNTVTLGNGNDYVHTGDGADVITVGNGAVTIQTGNGNKTITAGNGNDYVQAGTGANVVTLGNGSDTVQLGDGDNTVTLGNGHDYVHAGNGNNTVTVGDGAGDTVQVGGGNNVVVTGNGDGDYVSAGNGDNLIAAGTGQHTVQAGNGSNILVDGSVTLTRPGDSLRQVLADWAAGGAAPATVADIRSRLSVTYNTSHANYLAAGSGLDWFWFSAPQDQTTMKSTDLLN